MHPIIIFYFPSPVCTLHCTALLLQPALHDRTALVTTNPNPNPNRTALDWRLHACTAAMVVDYRTALHCSLHSLAAVHYTHTTTLTTGLPYTILYYSYTALHCSTTPHCNCTTLHTTLTPRHSTPKHYAIHYNYTTPCHYTTLHYTGYTTLHYTG
jgi:hypothetical protein